MQEPGFRMSRHTILTSRPQRREDVEFAAMPVDKPGLRTDTRGTGVSLFRSGQPNASPPVTLDLATGREIFAAPLPSSYVNPAKVWESLSPVTLSSAVLTANGLFLEVSNHPAAVAFDILRTRLLHGLTEKGWKRIAVTSPTHGCGKSFVATNLALSLSRRPSSRTALIDLDLRRPELARILGIRQDHALAEFLSGEQPLEAIFHRHGRTLALGLNGAPVEKASETLHDPDTVAALSAMLEQLDPEVVIYDLPPALVNDDVLAMAPCVDAVLLVTDGTKTSPEEIRACERMLEGRIPLMGVVLNRAQDFSAGRYRYAKG
jgi:protein-tyrosine kinase